MCACVYIYILCVYALYIFIDIHNTHMYCMSVGKTAGGSENSRFRKHAVRDRRPVLNGS